MKTNSKAMEGFPALQTVTLHLSASCDDTVLMDVSAALESEATSISWEKSKDHWAIQWVFPSPAPLSSLRTALKTLGVTIKLSDLMVSDVPDVNWLEESYRTFPPFQVGPFFIHGSHYQGKAPKGLITLQIDAATAFGSGEHGTTKGCLEALAKLKDMGFKPKRILDMGAGSGILGIAAYKLWRKPVLAVDIDAEATRMAMHHRRINGVPAGVDGMQCATGNGYHARAVTREYDLIIANILAGPLVDMAPDLRACLAPKGYAILSGLLTEQEDSVLAAHITQELTPVAATAHGEWSTLVLSRHKR